MIKSLFRLYYSCTDIFVLDLWYFNKCIAAVYGPSLRAICDISVCHFLVEGHLWHTNAHGLSLWRYLWHKSIAFVYSKLQRHVRTCLSADFTVNTLICKKTSKSLFNSKLQELNLIYYKLFIGSDFIISDQGWVPLVMDLFNREFNFI